MRSDLLEIRAAVVGVNGQKIVGYAIVFNQPSEDLGGFVEIITPAAVDRTLAEDLDVRALVDHDTSKIIGRTKAGTMILRKDAHGLLVEIHPPDTTAGRDILESVRRGDVTGMSFKFGVIRPHGERFEQRAGVTTRIVSDMRIPEVSVVTFPAYTATDVSVAQRALRRCRLPRLHPRVLRQRLRVATLHCRRDRWR
jgi:HK97 family phage prohead protease